MKIKNLPKLIVSILVCQEAGFLGAIFTTPSHFYPVPYLAWVSFAIVLNYQIWVLNLYPR